MADVQVKEEKGGKNKQKKQNLRVDFTPMVDMNMLLITFFMFCTTLLQPSTMNINMPSKDDGDETKARESTAVTILLGSDDDVYYYLGKIDEKDSEKTYNDAENFVTKSDYTPEGLRKLLLDKNRGTYELIEDLKLRWKNLEFPDSIYYKEVGQIQKDAMMVTKIAPTVLIKPTDFSTYKNMVDVLDEMLVCNIGAYAIVDLDDGDRYLLYKKTGIPDYLTDKQRRDAAK